MTKTLEEALLPHLSGVSVLGSDGKWRQKPSPRKAAAIAQAVREWLLSDENVERMAAWVAEYDGADPSEKCENTGLLVTDLFRADARAALEAVIGRTSTVQKGE